MFYIYRTCSNARGEKRNQAEQSEVEAIEEENIVPPADNATATTSNRELPDAIKPEVKYTSKKKSMDDFQHKLIAFMEKDNPIPVDDEIDLAFAALSKRIKRALPVELWDDLMDDMNDLVSQHIKKFKRKLPDLTEDEVTPVVHSIRRPPSPAVKISGEFQPMKPINFYSVRGGFDRQLEFEDL